MRLSLPNGLIASTEGFVHSFTRILDAQNILSSFASVSKMT